MSRRSQNERRISLTLSTYDRVLSLFQGQRVQDLDFSESHILSEEADLLALEGKGNVEEVGGVLDCFV